MLMKHFLLSILFATGVSLQAADCVENGKSNYFILLVDGYDCHRCSMMLKAVKPENKQKIKYTYFRNVPAFGQSDLTQQLGMDTSTAKNVNGYPCVEDFVNKLELLPGERSGIVKFETGAQQFVYTSIKQMLETQNENRFFNPPLVDSTRHLVKRTVLDYKRYFSQVPFAGKFQDYYVTSTNTSNGLLLFNQQGLFKQQLSIDTSNWKMLFEHYKSERLPDSLKKINNDSISLSLYKTEMATLGLNLWEFRSAFAYRDQLVAFVNVYFTIQKSEESLSQDGAEFLLVYDQKLKLASYYMMPYGILKGQYHAAAFNGIGAQNNQIRSFLYPTDSFTLKNQTLVSIGFVPSKQKNKLTLLDKDLRKLDKSIITSAFGNNANLFSLQHGYTEKSYLYFKTAPYLMNGSNELLPIKFGDSVTNYRNITCMEKGNDLLALITVNNTLQLVQLTLIASKEGESAHFIVKKSVKLSTILPAEEQLQTAFFNENTCFLISLNEQLGMVVNEVAVQFD